MRDVRRSDAVTRLLAQSFGLLAILLASACGGSSGEATGVTDRRWQLQIVAGGDLIDTVDARPVQALVVEVRSGGRPAAGIPVRFASVITAGNAARVTAASIDGRFLNVYYLLPDFVDTTDANGRARALLAFGPIAGTAKISATALTSDSGLSTTVDYVVRPGAATRLTLAVRDTTVFAGDTYQVGAAAVDRYGNARADQPIISAVDDRATVDQAGRITIGSTTGRGRIAVQVGALRDTSRFAALPRAPIVFVLPALTSARVVVIGNLDGRDTTRLDSLFRLTTAYPTIPASGLPMVFHEIARNVKPSGIGTIYIRTGSAPARPLLSQGEMYSASYPRITRDGDYVYFAGGRTDTSATAIWRVRPDGSQLERVTSPAASSDVHTQPALSPDGTRLAFSDAGAGTIVIMTLATGASYTIGSDAGMVPIFSPDGSRLAYLSWSSGVVVANVDGSDRRTVGDGWWGTPAVSWLSDGQWLLLPQTGALKVVHAVSGETIYVPRTFSMNEPSTRP